jgi:hypothetical protein
VSDNTHVTIHLDPRTPLPKGLPGVEEYYQDHIDDRQVVTYEFYDVTPWSVEDPLAAAGVNYLCTQDGNGGAYAPSVSCRVGTEFASCRALEGRPVVFMDEEGTCEVAEAKEYYQVRALFLATLPEA